MSGETSGILAGYEPRARCAFFKLTLHSLKVKMRRKLLHILIGSFLVQKLCDFSDRSLPVSHNSLIGQEQNVRPSLERQEVLNVFAVGSVPHAVVEEVIEVLLDVVKPLVEGGLAEVVARHGDVLHLARDENHARIFGPHLRGQELDWVVSFEDARTLEVLDVVSGDALDRVDKREEARINE